MPSTDETEIRELLNEMTDAWARGDATAYGARYQADATFTNVFGTFHVGHEEFDLRHDEVFRGIFRGTRVTMDIRKLRFLRPDVAVLDVDAGLFGAQIQPPGVTAHPDGAFRTCLLMVLTKQHGRWEIAAYHNVWRPAGH
jgi:uncharacterized protein (TIGR02246 family)